MKRLPGVVFHPLLTVIILSVCCVDDGCGGADSTWKTAERHKRQQYYGRRRPASQPQSSDQNPAEVDYDVDAMNQFYQDVQQSAANGRREQPPRPADSYNYVVDAAPTYSIKCYACHYQFEDNHGQGVFHCQDPFVPDNIPTVDCAGPCAKVFRKLHAKEDYSLTRSCMPNCKDSFSTECCLTSLCNSAGWTKVSPRLRFTVQHLLIIVLAAFVLVVSCLLSTR